MISDVKYLTNKASEADIAAHLSSCDTDFSPRLSERVEIADYAKKIVGTAMRFEAWSGKTLVGLVAAYCNDPEKGAAFVTNVSVFRAWRGQGIATRLVNQCVQHAKAVGMRQISLELASDNTAAVRLYEEIGFIVDKVKGTLVTMNLSLMGGESMNNRRDYNAEMKDTTDRKYAYNFDFEVMHHYMIKSFEPFFTKGRLLELGSFKGDFTRRLQAYSTDITCVEASDVAIAEAKEKVGGNVKFVNSQFEDVSLPGTYDNIVMTHVLEHLEDPVSVLSRVNKEWLAEEGRLFLVCPNANAPSRQIAVKMGLIAHNSAVTPAEAEHGHCRTYALDTLERDAVAGGLSVVHRSGIFFKALANFQWDRLLGTDIISQEYLDGCYKLGQQYPDLCSSIFLVCERRAIG